MSFCTSLSILQQNEFCFFVKSSCTTLRPFFVSYVLYSKVGGFFKIISQPNWANLKKKCFLHEKSLFQMNFFSRCFMSNQWHFTRQPHPLPNGITHLSCPLSTINTSNHAELLKLKHTSITQNFNPLTWANLLQVQGEIESDK